MENPNQNIVFSHLSKERVQETQNKHPEKKDRKGTLKKKWEENVQEEVPQNTQNTHFEENVQELTDFFFLDTRLVELCKTISTPIHPTFSWFMWLFISITGLFRPFHKKTEENDISGNE